MKISKAQLIEMKACADGLDRFIKQTNNTDEPVEVSSLVGSYVTYSDLLWLARKTMDRSKIIRFACDCALINIELIKPYTDQYDMIVEFLINPTDAVYAAAYDAAVYAAYTADAAAYAAAYAAVYAAASTGADAAYAASNAAADAISADKVNELLIKLFED